MPSIAPEFAHDIFISYRHNDNRTGWVSDFVRSLQEELATTIKQPVSIYFDSNPYDGLLETHNVDKSLEAKLKCLIFIPVLSQIYCDTRSFAWQNEFCVFNRNSQTDKTGREVTLRNGNVASRILPIVIHKLDGEDQLAIETELNSKLRYIDFNFQSPGVNRPLRREDKRQENAGLLVYHDQLNKLANAIKEIITAIHNPGVVKESPKVRPSVTDSTVPEATGIGEEKQFEKSLAVLPFANLSQDPSQEYFADGITENILIQLAGLPHFRVISRTSVMRFKKSEKSAPEIAQELGVKFIVEGTIQSHKEKVRISVQLIDAIRDQHVWSKVFVENMDDIFTLQGSVAESVAVELNTSFNPGQQGDAKAVPTRDLEAYDLFLKGRHAFNQWSVEGYRTASEYFKKAIARDHEFRDAYSYLASSYSARMSWNGDLSPAEALPQIEMYLKEAWQRGPQDNDHLTRAFIDFFISKDFVASEKWLRTALDLNPNNATVLYTYSYLLNMMGRFGEAAEKVREARQIDPLTVGYFNYHTISCYFMGQHEEAIHTVREALRLYPSVVRLYDFLARIYLTAGRFPEAIRAVESGFMLSPIRPPSMVAYQASSFAAMGDQERAKTLVDELIGRSKSNEKGVNIYLVYAFNGLGDIVNASYWLKKAKETNDVDLIWWEVDPLLRSLRERLSALRPAATADFEGAEKHILKRLEQEMPTLEYHNLSHILDVLQASLVIARSEAVPEEETRMIRVAALLHDIGFIHSPKNHEEKGAEISREILPAFGFSKPQVDAICSMILATRLPQSPSTPLERILCDADLDYLGRDDFFEIGGKLFHELKAQGFVETEREWNLVQKTFLESHRYHTNFGKTRREEQKKKRLQEITSRLTQR